MNQNDHVYIFHHIPKCGGTSMKKAFRKWFRIKNDYRPNWATDTRLQRFRSRPLVLEKLKPGTIVFGHYEVDGIYLQQRYPRIFNDSRYRVITFVREPFSLRLSLLRYEIEHNRLSGNESMENLLFNRPNWLCDRFPCTADNMDVILDRYFFIGIIEHCYESINLLADKLCKSQFHVPHINKTKPRHFPITDKMNSRFRKVHHLDYRLYQRCINRFEAMR